jgi:hypothetical protein
MASPTMEHALMCSACDLVQAGSVLTLRIWLVLKIIVERQTHLRAVRGVKHGRSGSAHLHALSATVPNMPALRSCARRAIWCRQGRARPLGRFKGRMWGGAACMRALLLVCGWLLQSACDLTKHRLGPAS